MLEIKTFINNFVVNTKTQIIALANSELDNTQKKAELDEYITTWATRALDTLPVNFVAKWVIRKYVIGNISVLTQAVYDLLKARIAGITKQA